MTRIAHQRFTLSLFGKSWIKLWTTRTLTDAKFRRCNPRERNMFFTCLMLAGESDAGGALVTGTVPLSDADVISHSGDRGERAANALKKIIAMNMVVRRDGVLFVTNFERCQESPSAAKMRRLRERARHGDGHTDGHIHGHSDQVSDGNGDRQKTEDRGQRTEDDVADSQQEPTENPSRSLTDRMLQACLTASQAQKAVKRGETFIEACLAYLDSPPDGVNPLKIIGACIRDGSWPSSPAQKPRSPEEQQRFDQWRREKADRNRPLTVGLSGAALEQRIWELYCQETGDAA
jgi:hypothetical protein